MGRFQFVILYFLLTGILFFRSTSGRSLGLHDLSVKTELDAKRVSADPPVPAVAESPETLSPAPEGWKEEGGENVKAEKHHSDKSVAGGGVIIGGLVTAIFAAVYCYIRVTRKQAGSESH